MDIFLVTYLDMESWVCLGSEEVRKTIKQICDWQKLYGIHGVLDNIIIEEVIETGFSVYENNPTCTASEFLEEYGLVEE